MSDTTQRLTMEEASQVLAEQVPGFFDILALSLNISTRALRTRIEDGALTKTQAIAALARMALDGTYRRT